MNTIEIKTDFSGLELQQAMWDLEAYCDNEGLGKPVLRQTDVRRCFYLIEDVKPTENGFYEVITNKGRVVTVHFENLLGNHIWEIDIDGHELEESVIAWCQNIA